MRNDESIVRLALERGLVSPEQVEALRPRATEGLGLAQVLVRERLLGVSDYVELARIAADGGGVERVGRYQVQGELGRGGMGVVYRALDPELGRAVALKVLVGGALASPQHVERFRREARMAARLSHPHVVTVHDVGTHQGAPWFAMDLVEGEGLGGRIPPGGVADPRPEFALLAKVARGVHYLHTQGIVHRDLKPSNILVDRHGEPHVTDFGLASDASGGDPLTRTGASLGTPSYMAPEQCRSSRDVDARADVWSLGAIACALLTGEPPYSGDSAVDVIRSVLRDEPVPSPRRLRPDAPTGAVAVTLKALEKDRDRRYPSAEALAEDLERYARGEPVEAREPGPLDRILGAAVRRRGPLAAAVLLAAAVAAAGAWALARSRGVEARSALLSARGHLGARRFEEAAVEASRAIAGLSGDPEALRVRAEAYRESGRPREALEDYDRLLRTAAPTPELQLARSAVLRELGRETEADSALAEARRLQGEEAYRDETARRTAEAWRAYVNHRHQEVLRLAALLLVRDPALLEARSLRAQSLRALGRKAEALGDARAVAEATPEDAGALQGLADCLAATGRPAEALAALDRAWAAAPGALARDSDFFRIYLESVLALEALDEPALEVRRRRLEWMAEATSSAPEASPARAWHRRALEALEALAREGR
ncbi:MAG: protein kinase [Planctomycetes bacterium]|nr:protein kinase [Planctomycetota bacterium]